MSTLYICEVCLFVHSVCVYTTHGKRVLSLSLCTRLIDQISTSSAGRFLSLCVCVCLHLYVCVCYPAADLGRLLLLLLLLSCVFSRCVFVYRWFDQTSERTRLHTLNFPCMYGSSLCWTHFRCFLPTYFSLVFPNVCCLVFFHSLFYFLFYLPSLIREQQRRRPKLCFAVKRKLYKCSFFSFFRCTPFSRKEKRSILSICRQPWLPFKSQRLHGCCCCCNSIADGRRWTGWPPIQWRQ